MNDMCMTLNVCILPAVVVGDCRLEVLHKVNNLVKEWIRDISIKKVSYPSV